MRASLQDLVSGVVGVELKNEEILESLPPQYNVLVEFGTGTVIETTASADELEHANTLVEGKRALVTDATTPAKAFKYYLQVAHNVIVDEAVAGDILATAKSA